MKHYILVSLIACIIPLVAKASETFVLARAPQLSPAVTSKIWTPFVEHLSKVTDLNISLKVYESRNEFEKDISKGEVDLYFGNPGYGVIGHLNHGYLPIIHSNRKLLEGIIVTRKNSGIDSIEKLEGKVISFPAKTAFAASLVIRYYLDKEYNIKFTPHYAGSHDNSYRTVLTNTAQASGGVKRTLERENVTLRSQLQIIYKTPGMKSHPLMVHPRVSAKNKKAIQTAILNLQKTKEGRTLLKKVKLQKPVVSSYEKDYKKIESFSKKSYKYLLN